MTVKNLRTRAGLTQEQLALASGLAVRTIRNIERDEVDHPRWESLKLIAGALGLPRDHLLGNGDVGAEDGNASLGGSSARRPTQLPPAAGDFTGRQTLLSQAAEALERTAEDVVPGAVRVLNFCGRPGVGKTTLAVALGHRVRERFEDGQLFVHLGGATPNPRPVHEVLAEMLISLGVEPGALPDGAAARAAAFRGLSTDRQLLVVIDDAADEQQVALLLPGAPSAVVVTSRRPLAGLPGVRAVDVDVLPHREGVELLTMIMGAPRAGAAAQDVASIASSCAGLPLALRIAGARLASRPNLPVAALALALDDERRRLDELRFADLEVRSTLNLACAALSEQHRSAFALLGRLDAPSVSRWTLGALVGSDEAAAQLTLDALVDARLVDAGPVDEFGEVRYALHDLLRLFAREMPISRERWILALGKVAGHWLTLAETADAALPMTSDVVTRGGSPRTPVPDDLRDRVHSHPLTWFRSEQAAIAAGVDQLVAHGLIEYAWELASCLRTYVVMHSSWDVWSRTHRVALVGCRAQHDARGEASMQFGLGKLRIDVHGAAREEPSELVAAAQLFAQLGDVVGEARALHELAHWNALYGEIDQAGEYCRRALTLAERAADAEVLADVLYMTGRVENRLGHDEASVEALERALTLARRLGKPRNEAQVLWQLASVLCRNEAWERSRSLLSAALGLVRSMDDRRGEICILLDLAKTHVALDDRARAEVELERALTVCDDIGEKSFQAQALVALARLRVDTGEPQAALRPLEHASILLRELDDEVQLEEIRRLIENLLTTASP